MDMTTAEILKNMIISQTRKNRCLGNYNATL